jgi:hypothetical protein
MSHAVVASLGGVKMTLLMAVPPWPSTLLW